MRSSDRHISSSPSSEAAKCRSMSYQWRSRSFLFIKSTFNNYSKSILLHNATLFLNIQTCKIVKCRLIQNLQYILHHKEFGAITLRIWPLWFFFPQINSQFSLEKKIDNFSFAISPKKYKLTNTENWCENQYVRFYFF